MVDSLTLEFRLIQQENQVLSYDIPEQRVRLLNNIKKLERIEQKMIEIEKQNKQADSLARRKHLRVIK